MINTPSEYSDYIKTAEMDINDPSSTSEMGPRSPLYTLESLHDIEELMGAEEITVGIYIIIDNFSHIINSISSQYYTISHISFFTLKM